MNLEWTARCMIGAVAAAALLAACGGGGAQIVPVDIRDTGAMIWSGRINVGTRALPDAEHPDYPPTTESIEVQYLGGSGESSQTLQAGKVIDVNGRSITGPQQVTHHLDLAYAHLAYSGTITLDGLGIPLELDVFAGLGAVDFGLRSDGSVAGPDALAMDQTSYGSSLGAGARWRFVKRGAVEGRFLVFTQNPLVFFAPDMWGSGDRTDLMEMELGLVFAPMKQLAVRAGYAMVQCTPKQSGASSLEATLRGPFLGVGVLF